MKDVRVTKLLHERMGIFSAIMIVTIAAILTQSWFLTAEGLVWGDDARFPLSPNLSTYTEQYFHIWGTDTAFGGMDVVKLPVMFPTALLLRLYQTSGLPFSPVIYERLYLLVLFVGMGLSMLYLSRQVYGQPKGFEPGSLFAALSYMFNMFVMTTILQSLGHLVLEYSFFPLLMGLYINGLEHSRGTTSAVLIAFAWTATITPAYSTATLLIIDWGLIALCFVYHAATSHGKAMAALRYTICLLLSWAALNAFWLIPVAALGSRQLEISYAPRTPGLSLYVHNSIPILDACRITGWRGLSSVYKEVLAYPWSVTYGSGLLSVLSFSLPLLACVGLLRSNRKYVTFFGLIAVMGIALLAGVNPPFGEINRAVFGVYPLNILFRDTYQRFAEIVALSFSVLAGAFLVGRSSG